MHYTPVHPKFLNENFSLKKLPCGMPVTNFIWDTMLYTGFAR